MADYRHVPRQCWAGGLALDFAHSSAVFQGMQALNQAQEPMVAAPMVAAAEAGSAAEAAAGIATDSAQL